VNNTRILLVGLLLLTLSSLVGGCGYITGEAVEFSFQPPAPEQFTRDVSITEAYAVIAMNAGRYNFVILDVRTTGEFAAGHIRSAINRDYYSTAFKNDIDKLDKTKLYVVYCQTGIRSAAVRDIMQELGFQRIYNMTGGFADWTAQGFPIVK
jgi:rhodanese-related sulfurtransferase